MKSKNKIHTKLNLTICIYSYHSRPTTSTKDPTHYKTPQATGDRNTDPQERTVPTRPTDEEHLGIPRAKNQFQVSQTHTECDPLTNGVKKKGDPPLEKKGVQKLEDIKSIYTPKPNTNVQETKDSERKTSRKKLILTKETAKNN